MSVPLHKLTAYDYTAQAWVSGPAAAILHLHRLPELRTALADPAYRRLTRRDTLRAWADATSDLDALERDALAILAPAGGAHLTPGARVHVTHGCDGPAVGCVWHTYTTNTTTSHGQVWPAENIVEVYVTGWGVQSYLAVDVHLCPRGCRETHPTKTRRAQNARNLSRAGATS